MSAPKKRMKVAVTKKKTIEATQEDIDDLVMSKFDRMADRMRTYSGGSLIRSDWKKLKAHIRTTVEEIDRLWP